jgi:hypothetical protein
VIVALTRVMRDLPGIGKTEHASQDQGGYPYRGIESITAHSQTLFAKHGIVMIPRVTDHQRIEITVGQNKVWHDEILEVVYTVYGPGGMDDSIEVGPLKAIGRDGTDKGVNKCMTQALKYALLQMLCIGDKKDDNDGTTDEATQDRDEPAEMIDELQASGLAARLTAIGKATGAYPKEWTRLQLPAIKNLEKMPLAWYETAVGALYMAEAALEPDEDEQPPPEPELETKESPLAPSGRRVLSDKEIVALEQLARVKGEPAPIFCNGGDGVIEPDDYIEDDDHRPWHKDCLAPATAEVSDAADEPPM